MLVPSFLSRDGAWFPSDHLHSGDSAPHSPPLSPLSGGIIHRPLSRGYRRVCAKTVATGQTVASALLCLSRALPGSQLSLYSESLAKDHGGTLRPLIQVHTGTIPEHNSVPQKKDLAGILTARINFPCCPASLTFRDCSRSQPSKLEADFFYTTDH